ncbi:MAG TPA: SRPBCC family protein [Chitinophagales bacterium]|nr:SRPBCC family protein [Chitinophagales bacterium]
MTKENEYPNETADRELVITRIINAPRELVFEAWTDPKHIVEWWGPDGFTTTIHEMDVRPGGVWRFIMHGPDGVDYPNRIVYTEIVKPERLVYEHDSDKENDPGQFHVTITFGEQGGKTKLIMHSIFKSAEALEEVKKFGAVEGGNQTLNRFEEYLAKRGL